MTHGLDHLVRRDGESGDELPGERSPLAWRFGFGLPGGSDWPVLLAAILAAGVLGWVAWQRLWSFWLDEAMLLDAVRQVESPAGLFRALPLYDQAAPTGFLLAVWAITKAGLPLFAQKILPLAAGFGTLACLLAAARRSGFGTTATAAVFFMAVGSFTYTFQFGNLKQYPFEMVAVSMLVLAAASERRHCDALLVAACAVTLLCSFVAPVVLVALVFLYRKASTPVLLAAMVALGIGFGAAYVTYVSAALRLNLTNYSYVYAAGFLPASPRALSGLIQIVLSHVPRLPVRTYDLQRLLTLLALTGTAFALWRRERVGSMFAAVLLVLAGLSVVRLYPFLMDRYSGYLLPFVAFLAGRGVQAAIAALRPLAARLPPRSGGLLRGAGQGAALLLVCLGLLCFVRGGRWFTEVGAPPVAAVAAARAAGPDAIVPVGLIQPQFDLVRGEAHAGGAERVIEVNPVSAPRPSDTEVLRRPPDIFDQPGSWAVYMRMQQVALDWLQTTSLLRPDDYHRWVMREAGAYRRVALILPTCMEHPLAPDNALVQGLTRVGTIQVLYDAACYRTVLWTAAGPASAPPAADAAPRRP